MAKAEQQVQVLLLDQYDGQAGGQTVGHQLIRLLLGSGYAAVLAIPDGPWGRASTLPIQRIDLTPRKLLAQALALRRVLTPDAVIIINGPRVAPLGILLRTLLPSSKSVFYLHNRPRRMIERILIYLAASLCTINVSVAQAISGLVPRARIQHNCARADLSVPVDHPLPATLKPTIKFLGRNDPVKGVDVLIAALRLLAVSEGLPDWQAELAVGPSLAGVDFEVPPATPKQVAVVAPTSAVWLQPGDILCLPSRFEASPLVAHEAFARGCILVASRAWGNAEVVPEDLGYQFRSEDPQDLARVLARALTEDDRRRTLSRVGRHHAIESRQRWESFWLCLMSELRPE